MTKDVISLSISVLLLFRHYISHKITFGAPSSGGVLCSACGAFICQCRMEVITAPRDFSSIFGKRPLAKKGEKMINLTLKLGEINVVEYNKGSKIYP